MFSKSSSKSANNGQASVQPVSSSPAKPGEAAKPVPPSIISNDLRMVGDLTSKGEIHVDGVIEGDIRCQVLVIGQSGAVTGEIIADMVRVHGTLTGQIRARSVFLAATARVVGDIAHESLAIEPGAFLEGHCGRMDKSQDLAAVPAVNDVAASIPTLTFSSDLKAASA
ncbi:MAG: polymer-forming cytoskeletal protein [Alphaproteobacteria bacterium]|nr:polymer-forming cytoskeletal protein [Alphaproteobacteria bacterium]